MTRFPRTLLYLTCLMIITALLTGADWRHFRGTDGNPSSDRPVPDHFDIKTGENIAWRAALPDRGASSPVIVGDQVLVTCSGGTRQDRLGVLSFDAATGKQQWRRQFWATGVTHVHPFSAVAQCTPATDGKRVFAFYSSNDLVCFDLQGNLKWYRSFNLENPTTRNDVGMASSALVVGPTVIVQMENQGESFVAGVDVDSGETRWRIERDHTAIWSSPTLFRGKTPAEDAVLLVSRDRLTAHDPQTGRQLWQHEASCHTVASPVGHEGIAYLAANGLHALHVDPEAGGVTPTWSQNRLRSFRSSPVIHQGRAYSIKAPGILVCGDLDSGKVLWQLRMKGDFWSTPVAAGDRLYAANDKGLVHVVALGKKGKLLRTCDFGEKILATPAVVDGALYLRSDKYLCKIALPETDKRPAVD
ncbi:MAG: PQQ-binding-like beta-propeller repeat protein [Pirellulales bacterium]|nr:PQQ-binding-like beta-propeller repeat protein [Pirellulales bacterium]